MKIIVFENEFSAVKGAFEAANLLSFESTLEIEDVASSQQANLAQIEDYSVVFIDIDLSKKSDLDGYGLIKKLESENPDILNRIVILTGNNKIAESLKERGILDTSLTIIRKPTNYLQIAEVIKKITTKKA